MLTTCSEPGCATLVMGGRCLEHERHPDRAFVRGRPFAGDRPETAGSGYGVATLAATGAVSTLDLPESAELAFEIRRR
ncbi:MAG: hypothetical protein L0206_11280 [Actinobacteria bacterium]|nr:hypothetical protein [Actinomycetota bacterium]